MMELLTDPQAWIALATLTVWALFADNPRSVTAANRAPSPIEIRALTA